MHLKILINKKRLNTTAVSDLLNMLINSISKFKTFEVLKLSAK